MPIFAFRWSCYLCRVMFKKYLIISTATDMVRIAPDKIVFISSDGNYCNLVQADNETRMLTPASFSLHRLPTSGPTMAA